MKFDILIIGGGHAGAEAAWISSFFDLRIALVTLPNIEIGLTPCNPSVGGVGKGQVVREIDALGGLMPIAADLSAIHYRTLNERKGYAVQSTRVQIDKKLYSEVVTKALVARENIEILYEKVESISMKDNDYCISTDSGTHLSSKLIITGGTYFAGRMHTGNEISHGGSIDSPIVSSVSSVFDMAPEIALSKRFKTGTPARIHHDSIRYSELTEQSSDPSARCFHSAHRFDERFQSQIKCYLTETNTRTMAIIRGNRERSPLFNGQINAVGPRYCPSIEDKAFRYTSKDCHHVFLERETIGGNTVYPSGLSTSLPTDVQEDFLHTMNGLEECSIENFGYAVEYDVINTTLLKQSLESKVLGGVFFAGQINGTSGYEEAAAQGIIAGINASLAIQGKNPILLDRNESYIGVLIEDLVSSERDEPYRLFTARSENRLFLREDNAVQRMSRYRAQLGLDVETDRYQEKFLREYTMLEKTCNETYYLPNLNNRDYFKRMGYGELQSSISLADLLRRSHLDPVITLSQQLAHFGVSFDCKIVFSCAISCKYQGYIKRQDVELQKYQKLQRKSINWRELAQSANISIECRQRIGRGQPETFFQLQRVEGVRPATLAYVASKL